MTLIQIALALLAADAPAAAPAAAVPQGTYVEARTAAVYAGACHFGGQYTTQGAEAVLGWHVERGAHAGESLAGVDVVAVIAGTKNLAAEGAQRSSVLYLDADASPAARRAAEAWLRGTQGALLGRIAAVRVAPVDVGRTGDAFRLRAGADVEIAGDALPERQCCKMSYDVWYEPFVELHGKLVGNTRVFRASEPALKRAWKRGGENDAFFGRFGGASESPAASEAAAGRS